MSKKDPKHITVCMNEAQYNLMNQIRMEKDCNESEAIRAMIDESIAYRNQRNPDWRTVKREWGINTKKKFKASTRGMNAYLTDDQMDALWAVRREVAIDRSEAIRTMLNEAIEYRKSLTAQ